MHAACQAATVSASTVAALHKELAEELGAADIRELSLQDFRDLRAWGLLKKFEERRLLHILQQVARGA